MQQRPEQHEKLPRELADMARGLERLSTEKADVLTSEVKQRQRAALLAHAEHILKPQAASPTPQKQPEKAPQRNWFAWGGFALAGALAVFALFLTNPSLTLKKPGLQALRIPSAHAQDAFTVFAEKKDAEGVTVDTAFAIESKVPVTEQQLKQSLTILPAIQYDLEKTSETQYRIVPKETLKEGEVYKVSIATVVEGETPVKREFSWALQTKQRFAVLSMIPADAAANVPVATGIEFQLTKAGFTAPSPEDFSITPAVEGTFEIRGRKLAFVPKKPLAPETIYKIVLAKDFASSTGLGELAQDIVMRFETYSPNEAALQAGTPVANPDIILPIAGQYTTVPTSTLDISLGYRWNNAEREYDEVEISGYSLTAEAAKNVARIQAELPGYSRFASYKPDLYSGIQKTQAFQSRLQVKTVNDRNDYLQLPAIDKGLYLVSFKAVAKNPAQKSRVSWSLIQVTDTAVYSVVDRDGIYLWIVDAGQKKAAKHLVVRKDQEQYQTNDEGLLKLSTPSSFLPSTSTKAEYEPYLVLEIGEGKQALIHTIQAHYYTPYASFFQPGYVSTGHNRTMSFMATDRALTRPTDRIEIFGLARDREDKKGVGEVKIRLTNQQYLYSVRDGDIKIYTETTAQTDSTGRFTASLDWKDLAPGYYQVELVLASGQVVNTQSVQIEEFTKPIYSMAVSTDKAEYVLGETIKLQAKVSFIEGTPVRGVRFMVRNSEPWLNIQQEIKTDESGTATLEMPTRYVGCEAHVPDVYTPCQAVFYPYIEVAPADGEEALMSTAVSPVVYRSRLDLDSTIQSLESGIASGTIHTILRDLSKSPSESVPTAASVTVTAYPKYYEKVERERIYDPINKVTVPVYDYVVKIDAPIVSTVQTSAEGVGSFSFPIRKDRFYEIVLESKDAENHLIRRNGFMSNWGQAQLHYTGSENPQSFPELVFSDPKRIKQAKNEYKPIEYDRNEEITATIKQDNKDYDVSTTPGVFTYIASRGIISADVDSSAKTSFRFEDRLIPNAVITKVTFKDGKFVLVRGTVTYSTDLDELEFDMKAEKSAYAPGEQINVEVTAKQALSKQSVSDVFIHFAAIDQAIIDLGGGVTINPIKAMYNWVADEILYDDSSHGIHNQYSGGAEKGGGGGDFAKLSVRSDFKDVAASGIVRTNEQGVAKISFKAPDNLTSWKLRVMGVSDTLQGGVGTTDIPVRKQVFIDVVMPTTVIQADKPTIKLRAFGSALTAGEEVQFQMDAPTLGINKQTFKGKAGESLTLSLEKNDIGKHRIEVGVVTSKGSDALERFITIVPSHVRSVELQSTEAFVGASLKEATAAETTVSIVSKGKGQYYDDILNLAWMNAIRADSYAAQILALTWLRDEFGEVVDQEIIADLKMAFTAYVDSDGTVKLKNYGSSDPLLTSELIATAPELLNRDALIRTLWTTLDKSSSRFEQIAAITGLAGLGEAVIPELDQMGAVEDLSVRERLAIARGMELAGNREASRAQLDRVLQGMKTQDKLAWIEVEKNATESLEMTADAAALAIKLADPRAESLKEYVDTHWTEEAFPVLAKARYIRAGLATAYSKDIVLKYMVDGSEKELVFNSTRSAHQLRLTKEEVNRFRVTSVNGPLQINQVSIVSKRPTSVPGLTLKRAYTEEGSTSTTALDLQEGDRIKVTITAQWDEKAQSGCYLVQDFLPSNARAINVWSSFDSGMAITKQAPQETNVVLCNDTSETRTKSFTYQARIISRGSYLAEAPLMQHVDYPTIATNGTDEIITVK